MYMTCTVQIQNHIIDIKFTLETDSVNIQKRCWLFFQLLELDEFTQKAHAKTAMFYNGLWWDMKKNTWI